MPCPMLRDACCISHGFTLFEVVLSIFLISLLATVTLTAFLALNTNNNLNLAAETVAAAYRQAEQSSRAVDGDATWGVRVSSTALTVFKGASFVARDANYDEVTGFSSLDSVTGTVELVFGKLTGRPPSAVTTTLTGTDQTIKNITVNAFGTVDY